jgi:antitoxin VapB
VNELSTKCERLLRLAGDIGVRGILLTLQPNFAWLTGGRSNRIDGSREAGAGALLVTVDGRRVALASRIERARLEDEALAGLGFEMVEYAWTDERADPGLVPRLAGEIAGGRIGTDGPAADALPLDSAIARLRTPLLPSEIDRYRNLGRDLGVAIGAAARSVAAGCTERDAAAQLGGALVARGMRPIVLLVAADGRITRYRHPTPTDARWTRTLLLATCAEREGLVAAASRLLANGPPDSELVRRTDATAAVAAALLEATQDGTSGAQLFHAAASAYAAAGFPGEEALHHQGGAIGYRGREWVAHPRSEDRVIAPQAFAWNPTVTGTKIEETVILHADGRLEVITGSPDWPAIPVSVRGRSIALPGILPLL